MKGFRFRLEPVLGVREFSLERARLRLAEDVVAYERARDEVANAADTARATEQALAARLREGVAAAEVRAAAAALADRRLDSQAAAERSAAALAQVDEARERVRGAHAAVRAIEILREKAFAAWQAEWRRREQRELDEVAVERARRAAGARG
jgi:flagellar export protein FliJ